MPSDKVTEIPKLIENKMKHLTPIEKSNTKLATILKEMLIRSKDKQNFIDPLSSDYSALFRNLVKMPPIVEVRENFQYEFSE